jgi:hypothetical protein
MLPEILETDFNGTANASADSKLVSGGSPVAPQKTKEAKKPNSEPVFHLFK